MSEIPSHQGEQIRRPQFTLTNIFLVTTATAAVIGLLVEGCPNQKLRSDLIQARKEIDTLKKLQEKGPAKEALRKIEQADKSVAYLLNVVNDRAEITNDDIRVYTAMQNQRKEMEELLRRLQGVGDPSSFNVKVPPIVLYPRFLKKDDPIIDELKKEFTSSKNIKYNYNFDSFALTPDGDLALRLNGSDQYYVTEIVRNPRWENIHLGDFRPAILQE